VNRPINSLISISFIIAIFIFSIIFIFEALAKTPESKTSLINEKDEITISYIGSTLWGGMRNTVIKDNYAFCSFPCGLEVLDISNPAMPEFVSNLYASDGNSVLRIYVEDTIAYLIEWTGFKTVSIADPENPYLVGNYETSGQLQDIVVSDTIAYLADIDNGLRLVNVSHPEAPVDIATNGDVYGPRRVAIVDTLAYMAAYTSGLQIVNIADPLATTLLGEVDTVGKVVNIAVVDTLAYLAAQEGGLQIANIADPLNPFIISIFETGTNVYDIAVEDTIAYIRAADSGLMAINVADPNSPVTISSYVISGYDLFYNDYIYAVSSTIGLEIVDITDPTSPVTIGSYETYEDFNDMEIVGDYAYLVGDELYIVDITDPSNPAIVGNCNLPYFNWRLAVSDTIAYLTARDGSPDYDGYLHIVNIADPGAPYLLNTFPIPEDYPRDVAVMGDYVYVIHGDVISIFDVSDPANPVGEGVFPEYPGYDDYIKIIGDRAYVGNLIIYDVSIPQTPVFEGRYVGGKGTSVAVDDTVAYVSGYAFEIYFGWLATVSISDITNPYFIGYIDFGGSYNEAWDVAVSNDNAFVVLNSGLKIVNVSDPANLIDVGDFAPSCSPTKIEIRDNYIYLATSCGFFIFQIHAAEFICGDTDGSGIIDLLDITYFISYLYRGGSTPNPLIAADVNNSGGVNLLDIIYLINYLYKSGPEPECPQGKQ